MSTRFSGKDVGYPSGSPYGARRQWTKKELRILYRVKAMKFVDAEVSQYWLVKAALGILKEFKFERTYNAVEAKMRKMGMLKIPRKVTVDD